MHITLCTLHFHIALCSLHYVYCTMYIALCTLHYAHCTLHISQCTLYYVNCTSLSPVRNRNSASPTPQHHLQSEENRVLSLPKPTSESRYLGRIWRICSIFNNMWASIQSFNLKHKFLFEVEVTLAVGVKRNGCMYNVQYMWQSRQVVKLARAVALQSVSVRGAII